jgi:hypothetical protein
MRMLLIGAGHGIAPISGFVFSGRKYAKKDIKPCCKHTFSLVLMLAVPYTEKSRMFIGIAIFQEREWFV